VGRLGRWFALSFSRPSKITSPPFFPPVGFAVEKERGYIYVYGIGLGGEAKSCLKAIGGGGVNEQMEGRV
jgi:hypothetical protein